MTRAMRVTMPNIPEYSVPPRNSWSPSTQVPHRVDGALSSPHRNLEGPMVKQDHPAGAAPGVTTQGDHSSRRYRVLSRKKGKACDVEMTEADAEPHIVIAFDTEAEAWDWVNEQQTVDKSTAGHAKVRLDRLSASPATDDLKRLGELAVAELEHRGYDVRGKSAEQIKKILRFPPPRSRIGPELP